ncbi:MAG: hypothetical protein DRJ52_02530 [Thermoprotei archaeon]|nr:MAG: hypothetical protein DRJ52_02530 [Thermoprotei archaeon]RLF00636.1 MAG: hypothetical protein DRJ63_01720 [Thermoprotei archaeon]
MRAELKLKETRFKGYIFKEFYAVNPPLAYVAIAKDKRGFLKYLVIEPLLSDYEKKALDEVKRIFLDFIESSEKLMIEAKSEEFVQNTIVKIIKKFRIKVPKPSIHKIIYYIKRDFLGYGKIDVMIRDENLEDISCDGVGIPVYVWHKYYESIPSNIVFETEDELEAMIHRLAYKAGKHISIAKPILEGSLPEGFRIHLTLKEVSMRGGTFTIRKFRAVPFTIIDLISLNTVSPELAAYFWLAVDNMRTIIISGATATGKTTMLNAIATFIRPELKIVTIEEVPEIRLPHENWIPLVTRPSTEAGVENITLYDLLKSALRQRPDYIIIGEVRGEEAFTLFQAIASGHAGMCTIHAESCEAAVMRLQARPMNVPPELIPFANVFVQMVRHKLGDRAVRRVYEVYEVLGYDRAKGEVKMKRVFRWDARRDIFVQVGESELLKKIAERNFVTLNEIMEEWHRRAEILNILALRKIKSFDEVAEFINKYYRSPREAYTSLKAGAII